MNETGTSESGKSQLDKFRQTVRELDADDDEVHSNEKCASWWTNPRELARPDMSSRHTRRKRAAVKRVHRELALAEAAERRAREDIIRANVREIRSMTPEQVEAFKIQRKADASYKTSTLDQPSRGRGSGGYLGAHTVIGPHTPEWFGDGSE